jgi:hypothetical protein
MASRELQACKQQLAHIERQTAALSAKIRRLEEAEARNNHTDDANQQISVQSPDLRHNVETKSTQTQVIGDIEIARPQPVRNIEKQKEKNLESQVGKNLFAVLASLLILIGVGVFVAAIYEQISETLKICAIYILGFVLLGGSLVLYRKNKNNFWLGVASCGAAELLVAIISCYVYFKIIALPATYILIMIWVAGIFALTKINQPLFKTISYVGFIVSMVFGLSLLGEMDGATFIVLFITYAALSIFFAFSCPNLRGLNIGMLYCSTIFSMAFFTERFYLNAETLLQNDPINLTNYIIILTVIFNVVHAMRAKENKTSYSIYSCITSTLLCILFASIGDAALHISTILSITLLWAANIYVSGPNKESRIYGIFSIILLAIVNSECIGYIETNSYFTTSMLLLIPIAMWVLLYNKTGDHCSAAAAFAAFMPFMVSDYDFHAWVCAAIAMSLFTLTSNKDKYGEWYKNIWYAIGAYCLVNAICIIGDNTIEIHEHINKYPRSLVRKTYESIAIAATTIINLFRVHADVQKNKKFTKSPSAITLHFLNGILLVWGMSILKSRLDYNIPAAVASLAANKYLIMVMLIASTMAILASSLRHSIMTKWENQNLTMIHCIKFTIYFWVIATIFTGDAVIISILLLSLAIISIVVGFKTRSKAARIYGLALSFICSASLALTSMSFDSSMQIAGGIIICGVLCFVISFIYSKAAKAFELENAQLDESIKTNLLENGDIIRHDEQTNDT